MVSRIRGFEDYLNIPQGTDVPLNSSAKIELEQVLNCLTELDIEYWIADGTLLGFYRDNKFIPHDTDIDFYTLECDKFDQLRSAMNALGFQVGRDMRKRGFQFQLTFISPTGNLIDFCNWRRVDSKTVEFFAPEISYPRKQLLSYFSSFGRYRFADMEYSSFVNVELWLEMMYGGDWHVPEKSKSDWREHVRDR
jgi:hypothetical protein